MGKISKERFQDILYRVRERMSLSPAVDDIEFMDILQSVLFEEASDLPVDEMFALADRIEAKLRKPLGPIDDYANVDVTVNEIMVNGPNRIFIEKGGGLLPVPLRFDSREELEEVIRSIAASVHREINEMNPILDARLPNGSRVNAVYRNVALDGPVLTIRKFASEHISLEQMIRSGTLTKECASYLRTLVKCGYNIFISGGTSSGKTTFLNALADCIPVTERVIVIEDSRELYLPQISNLVQMECHNANTLGKGQVTMDMLIRTSLRMRPDRIIIGEVRGGEVADMLQALNTGHDGSLSTGHGNSVSGMLRRLEAMYLMAVQIPMDAIRAQITEGIDIMVHLGRQKDGSRRVLEVQELLGYEDGAYRLNSLFTLDPGNKLVRTGNSLQRRYKLTLQGKGNVDGL